MSSQDTFYQQIQDIKKLLPERWAKGGYFRVVDDNICCCVHGAAQYVCNPKVKKILKDFFSCSGNRSVASEFAGGVLTSSTVQKGSATATRAAEREAPTAASGVAAAKARVAAKLKVWSARPKWVKKKLDLHYLLGMFGITAGYNDAGSTTLGLLQEKLEECAEWARDNEEFLKSC